MAEEHSSTTKTFKASRRGFLQAAGTTALGGALGFTVSNAGGVMPAAQAAEGQGEGFLYSKDPDALIKHSGKTFETKRGRIGTSVVTSNDIFFVRGRLPIPERSYVENRDSWEIEFDGVKTPQKMTLGDLKKMGVTTVATVLQCSGNGRGLFDHKASGSPWTVGAAGCALWSGIPLKQVVESLGGAVDGAKFITSTGGETLPKGVDPKTVIIERSVPVEALENALLAWEMNGDDLPLAHGGPLRIVLPGYYGVNNVKFVKKVSLTEAETDAKVQQTSYRVRPVGEKGAPDQPTCWEMNVKSWVTSPTETAEAGKVQIKGVAMGGTKGVSKVEVSTDGGANWKEATFVGPDLGQFAWRPFVFEAELPAGEHTIASRATDVDGESQPKDVEENHRGYLHNGWLDHAVTVKVG